MARTGMKSHRIRGAGLFATVAVAALLAGCGSSSSKSSSSSNGGGAANTASAAGGSPSTSSGGGALAAAQKIVNLAETKLLYGPTTGPAAASQLRAPTAADIHVMPYKPPAGKSIMFVSCSAQSAQCTHSAE